jgi:hypothetical protein
MKPAPRHRPLLPRPSYYGPSGELLRRQSRDGVWPLRSSVTGEPFYKPDLLEVYLERGVEALRRWHLTGLFG